LVADVTAVAALLGVSTAVGIVLFVVGLRGIEPRPAKPPTTRQRDEQRGVRVGLAVGAGVLVGTLTRWPVAALLAAVAAFLIPNLLGAKAAREAQVAKVEAIAGWAEMLRDTLAGAGGLEQSITATAGVAPLAIRSQVLALAAQLERERLTPALRSFADALNDPTGDLVVAALVLAADKSPKRLGDLLGSLAASARSDVNMRLRVDAGRARTRTSVRVVTASTVIFAFLLVILNRGYLDPYDSLVGQGVLALVGACFAGAFWWLSRASKDAPVERLLSSVASEQSP
jgi:hypothetical protein